MVTTWKSAWILDGSEGGAGMWGWQCVGGWHGGGVVAMFLFFYFFLVAGARGRGRKRGKGRESEIVKKRIFK